MVNPAASAKLEAITRPKATMVRDSWYVAAWTDEIAHQPFGRTIVGEPIVFFRTTKGEVVALQDRCAHRRMPLSLGRLTEDDRLICAYHGLAYDERGVCVHVPGQTSTSGLRLRAYPVEERLGLVWVWMGPPDEADASEIFDCSWLARPGWSHTRLYRHTKANYLLINDNLADLLHIAYLHMPSGAGNEHMGPAETEFKVEGSTYHFVRMTRNIPCPTTFVRLSNAKGNVDRWFIVDFKGPSFFRVYVGAAETGTGGPDSTLPEGQGRWTIYPHHFITPETEKTTHYFQVVGHEWAATPETVKFQNAVIAEDIWAIEHQQRSIDTWPEAPTFAIGSDAPLFAMRKIVDRMRAAEAG
jgi:phenylpropionate dioxygenase-like ring-hydroxylating dioxygenase large terminal subunit